LRGIKPDEAEAICAVLEKTGISIVEVPLNSPAPLESISILSRVFGSRMLIGAGTLTDPQQVAEVAAAGGKLIVTPHADTTIVHAAKATGLFAVPGFSTPTEAIALLRAGADAIKLFPADVLGIPMLKALQAVLPHSSIIIPVGGITSENLASWMAVGVRGVGAASSIYRSGDSPSTVEAKAKALVDVARSYKMSATAHKV
jgi:2-dehydro-3-deoxyphosphogalactonate aldolase